MKIKGLSWLVAISALLLMAGTSIAQQGRSHADAPTHSHKAPHGGLVRSVGDYHIELVEGKSKYTVYLSDMHEHSVPLQNVSGMAILRDGDRTIGSSPLTPIANSHFEIPLKGLAPTAVIINLKVNGQSLVAKFNKDTASALNFFCPQKCEGSTSNIAGVCPKCGTALIDRRLVSN